MVSFKLAANKSLKARIDVSTEQLFGSKRCCRNDTIKKSTDASARDASVLLI